MNKICVVIPMYGKAELTNNCIDFCRANAGIEHDILVVDDGSKEPYKHLGVNVIRLEENSGFTAATNAGILWCGDRYDYIHLLNNDTEPMKDFLKILYDALQADPAVGIASSVRVLDKDGKKIRELHAVDLISGYQSLADYGVNLPDVIHSYWVPLCSALIRHELIREIGLLDKRMRMWCSDNDYCIRANFAGWNTSLIVKSEVFHYHQATTGKTISKDVAVDQDVLFAKTTGAQYADLMEKLPLDHGSNTWGRLDFQAYKK